MYLLVIWSEASKSIIHRDKLRQEKSRGKLPMCANETLRLPNDALIFSSFKSLSTCSTEWVGVNTVSTGKIG